MQFPEELDNRTFRLFIQRTRERMLLKKRLSRYEEQMAFLVSEFSELGFMDLKKKLDVNQLYLYPEENPFIYLAAIWEITQHIQKDKPKGMRTIASQLLKDSQLYKEKFYQLADYYLLQFEKSKKENVILSDVDYIYDVQLVLNEKHPDFTEMKEYPPQLSSPTFHNNKRYYNKLFLAINRSMYEKIDNQILTMDIDCFSTLSKLPLEWINATVLYWQRPEEKLKREKVRDLAHYLGSSETYPKIVGKLSRDEIECLSVLLNSGGFCEYARMSEQFGPQGIDDYWWTQKQPRSTIGRLRLKGLCTVGIIKKNSEQQKMVIIPKDLRNNIKTIV